MSAKGHAWLKANRMLYCWDALVQARVLDSMDPTQRLCAYDEWHPILLSWMRECTGDDVDRFLRLHTILSRCIHE